MFGDLFRVGLGPFAHGADFFHQRLDHFRVFFGVRLGGQVELMVVGNAGAVTQGAGLQLLLG